MKPRLAIFLIFSACGLVILGVGVFRAGQAGEIAVVSSVPTAWVRCEQMKLTEHTLTATYYGRIQPDARIEMAMQISGRVTQLGETAESVLEEGDTIREGQVLARLEPSFYEASRDQSKASLLEADATRATVRADISRAQVILEDAELEFTRRSEVFELGGANQLEIDKAQLAVRRAVAELAAADARQGSAEAAYEAASAGVRMSEVNLDYTTLRAPRDCSVANVHVEVGQMVIPGEPVVTLVDNRSVKLVVGVVERRLAALRLGQEVTVEIQALRAGRLAHAEDRAVGKGGRDHEGWIRQAKVSVIPPTVDVATGLFLVEIRLANENGRIRPGMVGKAVIVVDRVRGYRVPAEVTLRRGDRVAAFFVELNATEELDFDEMERQHPAGKAAIARYVMLNPIASTQGHYIVSDAPEGMSLLVVEGHSRLTDGQRVEVLPYLDVSGGSTAGMKSRPMASDQTTSR